MNFVQYKFSHLAPKERQTMFELSKMFLLCLNYWKLETPTQYRQRTQKDDGTAYKVDYTRCVHLILEKADAYIYLFLKWLLYVNLCNKVFLLMIAGGCAIAMFHKVTTAYRATKPLRCLGATCSSPFSPSPDANSWRSLGWRRINCYQRNVHLSSHISPSKDKL